MGTNAQNDNESLQKLTFILEFVYNIQLMMALRLIIYLTLGWEACQYLLYVDLFFWLVTKDKFRFKQFGLNKKI